MGGLEAVAPAESSRAAAAAEQQQQLTATVEHATITTTAHTPHLRGRRGQVVRGGLSGDAGGSGRVAGSGVGLSAAGGRAVAAGRLHAMVPLIFLLLVHI